VLPFLADIGKKYQPDDLFPLSAFNKPDTKALRALILKYLPEQDNITLQKTFNALTRFGANEL
jgi:GTP-binding protein Era